MNRYKLYKKFQNQWGGPPRPPGHFAQPAPPPPGPPGPPQVDPATGQPFDVNAMMMMGMVNRMNFKLL